MTTTGNNSHTTTLVAGHLSEDIGTTNFDIACNDTNGYSVYAVGYTNNEYGNTDLEYTVLEDQGGGEEEQTYTIGTGVFDAGNTNTSVWSMKLTATENETNNGQYTPDIETGYDDYNEVPDTFTKVVSKDSPTDVYDANEDEAELNNARFTSTYSVYATPTQHTGTYKGKVAYVLVHPEDADTPTEEDIVVTPEGETADVTPPASCATPVPNLTYMQDLNSSNKASIIAGMTEDAQYFLADSRDNKTYCVSLLKDGNIWMTQNLDLDIDSTRTYTPADTDIASNWTPVASTHETNNTEWGEYDEDTNPDSGDRFHAESYDPGELYINPAYIEYQNTGEGEEPSETVSDVAESNSHYHLGNYYNWSAAVATNDTSEYDTDDTDLDRSICPAGWTLPKSGSNTSNGSAYYMFNQYGWNENTYMLTGYTLYESPMYLNLAGGWYGSPEDVGYNGGFWSPVVSSSADAYYYYASIDGNAYPSNDNNRDYGVSVRCMTRF